VSERRWRYRLCLYGSDVTVFVDEYGASARVRSGLGTDSRATTPRGLRAVLSRIYKNLQSSD
jgi:hypothetical protein